MATAAAPTFLKPHITESAVELIDGGVWANNLIGVAAIEAIGILGWPGHRLRILSIGTINEPGKLPRLRGKLPMASATARLFMAGQAHSALGTAKIITGGIIPFRWATSSRNPWAALSRFRRATSSESAATRRRLGPDGCFPWATVRRLCTLRTIANRR